MNDEQGKGGSSLKEGGIIGYGEKIGVVRGGDT